LLPEWRQPPPKLGRDIVILDDFINLLETNIEFVEHLIEKGFLKLVFIYSVSRMASTEVDKQCIFQPFFC